MFTLTYTLLKEMRLEKLEAMICYVDATYLTDLQIYFSFIFVNFK